MVGKDWLGLSVGLLMAKVGWRLQETGWIVTKAKTQFKTCGQELAG